MYRQYENPVALETNLEDAKKRLTEAVARNTGTIELEDLHDTIMDLEERVNFAWQDAQEDW